MNILASTTRQWNCGDEFILFGVINLLTEYFRRRPNVLIYDRNPDHFGRPQLRSNSWRGETLQHIDLVVLAGTPEWWGRPLQPLFSAVAAADVPLIALGVGAVTNRLALSALDRQVLGRATRVIVRDSLAQQGLLAHGIGSSLMPCPALFAAQQTQAPTAQRRVGLTLQDDRMSSQRVPTHLRDGAITLGRDLERDGWQVEIIGHYKDDWALSQRLGWTCHYSFDARDYLDIYAQFDAVISTRLHGAVLAASLGIPCMLINRDPRCSGAARQFPDIVMSDLAGARTAFHAMDLPALHDRLTAHKNASRMRYISLLDGL